MNRKTPTVVGLVLMSILVESASNYSTPAQAVNCSSHVWRLGNCSSFVSRGSTTKKPQSSCCYGLKTLLSLDSDCLFTVGTVSSNPGDIQSYNVNNHTDQGNQSRETLKIDIGLAIGAIVLVILTVIGCCFQLKNPSNKPRDNQNLDGLIQQYGFLAPKRYSFSENEIAKKMTIVGLWCIQNGTSQRPAMSKVIEMLEGSLDAMEIPPKPFFDSPSRTETDSSDRHILEDIIEAQDYFQF